MIVEAILAEIGPAGAGRSEETMSTDVPDNLKRFFAGVVLARNTSSCCSTDEQATCCDQAQKAGCCGDSASSSCGCR
jgi:hypothetical protein